MGDWHGKIVIREGKDFSAGPAYHDGQNIFFDMAMGKKVDSGETSTNGTLIDIDGTVTNGIYVDVDGTCTNGIHVDGATVGIYLGNNPTGIKMDNVGVAGEHFIDMIDAYTGMVIETGTYASAASKGVTLSATNFRPVTFLFDDGGSALGAANYRGVLSRVYLAESQTGQIALRAMRGQVKVASTKNLNIGTNEMNAINGIEGYIELAGTHTIGANTRVAGVHSLVEVNDDVTLTTGGKLVGVYAELSQVTAKTVSGIGSAGFLVDRLDSDHSTNQALWTTGMVIASGATVTGINIGTCTDGIIFTGTVTEKCIDFGQVTLSGDSCCNIWSYGDGDGAVTKVISDYFFVTRINYASTTNPGSEVLTSCAFNKISVTTAHQANLDIQGIAMTIDVGKNVGYAHAIEGLVDITASCTTSTGTVIGGKFALDFSSGATLTHGIGDNASAVLGLITGTGGYAGGMETSLFEARKEGATTIDHGLWVNVLTGGTVTNGIRFGGAGSITYALDFDGTDGGSGAKVVQATMDGDVADALIKVSIDGTAYYVPAFNAAGITGEW
jgi:hypothetical protein